MRELRLQEAMSSGLHDYEVGEISADYCSGRVDLTLTSPEGVMCRLPLLGFRLLRVTRTEPWGPGIYVSCSDLTRTDDHRDRLWLQLNSGDEVTVELTGRTEEP